MASIGDRSFDPDHEPRKEGTLKMKHSPSIAEIVPDTSGHQSDGASIPGKRGSLSRSPQRVMQHVTDNEDDSNANYRSLNGDSKHTRSNRKIKPIQYGMNNAGGKQMLKVVKEDDNTSGGSGSHAYLPKSNFMSIVTSPQYQQIQHPHQQKILSRERNGKIILNNQAASRNYGIGHGQKEPLKLVNVYSNVQQKRQAARQVLNKKSSEEKLHSNSILYNNRKPIEQRYKSHLRGQDAP